MFAHAQSTILSNVYFHTVILMFTFFNQSKSKAGVANQIFLLFFGGFFVKDQPLVVVISIVNEVIRSNFNQHKKHKKNKKHKKPNK